MGPLALGGAMIAKTIAKAAFAYAAPKLVKAAGDKLIGNESEKPSTTKKVSSPAQNIHIDINVLAQQDDHDNHIRDNVMSRMTLYSPGSKLSEIGKPNNDDITLSWTGGGAGKPGNDDVKLSWTGGGAGKPGNDDVKLG